MDRRTFALSLPATAAVLAALPAAAAEQGRSASGELDAALARYQALPGKTSCLIAAGKDGGKLKEAHAPGDTLFVGSAVKTFILARYLKDVESGRLSEDELLTIDDGVRSFSSPVLLEMSGKMPARSVLEAMIAHSDNTATDACMAKVGADRVRAFIADAGLHATRIPDSTRRLFAYIAGAPAGTDPGWAAMQQLKDDKYFGPLRPPINDVQTMVSSAEDMVSYYERALRGAFFAKPETLKEFKRIQAMANAISMVVPQDHAAYAKGGSIDWQDFHALSIPGQMFVGATPVTFCLTFNWSGPAQDLPRQSAAYAGAVSSVLAAVVRELA
jgi:beta-lactamase class A